MRARQENMIDGPPFEVTSSVFEALGFFIPNSSPGHGGDLEQARLILADARAFFTGLVGLIAQHRGDLREARREIASLPLSFRGEALAALLRDRFDAYGSDKASPHGYQRLYAKILSTLPAGPDFALLEIGLGTNFTDIPSNMGEGGRPGASLRAFRDVLPNAQIYGADIDERILFEEERIATFPVDQLNRESFSTLATRLPRKPALVIDDGLRSPGANLNTILAAFEHLLPAEGIVVVEDIPDDRLEPWTLGIFVLRELGYHATIWQASADNVLVVSRRPQDFLID
jgi:hypothetical protein